MTYYYPAPYSAAPHPAHRTVRTWDLVLAIVLYALASGVGLCTAAFTPFFAMATDPCGAGSGCREEFATWGILVSWGGTAAALGGGLIMLILAAVKGWTVWVWGALALLLVPLSFGVGLWLAGQVTG
ncbi:hypothetical protein BJY24_002828 [Nocardia transvalensis]|uniref:Uncharacterized protein n=1 Tax=Nocardia transvalensis TaxID=37333 RepID=A0A7W9PD40_9NOCA|nr:hypothetical protein [Nocardia transvalensis]MBB5913961.1 hypothetical protein [Nocardia transvalensis]